MRKVAAVALTCGGAAPGYVEFGVAGRMFMEGEFRRLLHAQIALQTLEQDLDEAATLEECWDVLRRHYREFGFVYVRAKLAGRTWVDGIEERAEGHWELRIPIAEFGFIDFRHGFGPAGKHNIVVMLIDALHRKLESKLRRMRDVERAAVAGD